MSHIVSGIAQQRRVGSATRKAILMHMAGIASDNGAGIWTSKANMARDLEMGRRTVQENIDKLIEMGVVSAVGSRGCKHGFTVEYRINVAALEGLERTRATAAPVREPHMTRAGAAHEPVREPHPNHPITTHEPSLIKCDFDEFWSLVPKKVAKDRAEKAYLKALKKAPHEEICRGMKAYAASRQGKDATYTAHPATWLNDGRWSDADNQPAPKSKSGSINFAAEKIKRGLGGTVRPDEARDAIAANLCTIEEARAAGVMV